MRWPLFVILSAIAVAILLIFLGSAAATEDHFWIEADPLYQIPASHSTSGQRGPHCCGPTHCKPMPAGHVSYDPATDSYQVTPVPGLPFTDQLVFASADVYVVPDDVDPRENWICYMNTRATCLFIAPAGG
jgi:hypothetical protein